MAGPRAVAGRRSGQTRRSAGRRGGRHLLGSAPVAAVAPFRALHFDPARTGGLAPVVAPPYDVIDEDERRALVARSPYNVVEIDLPRAPDGGDPYAHAAETL